MDQLKARLKGVLRVSNSIEWQPIDNPLGWIGYVLKAPTKSAHCKDLSAHDRVLFKPEVSLRRNGTVGPFYAMPKSALVKLWQANAKAYNEAANEAYLAANPTLSQQIDAHIKTVGAMFPTSPTEATPSQTIAADHRHKLAGDCRRKGIKELGDHLKELKESPRLKTKKPTPHSAERREPAFPFPNVPKGLGESKGKKPKAVMPSPTKWHPKEPEAPPEGTLSSDDPPELSTRQSHNFGPNQSRFVYKAQSDKKSVQLSNTKALP